MIQNQPATTGSAWTETVVYSFGDGATMNSTLAVIGAGARILAT
jgi:hypothetical protein